MVKAWQVAVGLGGVALLVFGIMNSNLVQTSQQKQVEQIVDQKLARNDFENTAYQMIDTCVNALPQGNADCNAAFKNTLMPMCDQSIKAGKAYDYCGDDRYHRYIMELNLAGLPVYTNQK